VEPMKEVIGNATLYLGDALETLQGMDDESVHCCVTSPPYYGLRDYGVDRQIGLEDTPQDYITKMVEVFHEVRKVLRSDGTAWVNMGDTYSSGRRTTQTRDTFRDAASGKHDYLNGTAVRAGRQEGFKPKDMMGMPWRLAFALQDDGWYLRQDIIWNKPNPMPESVRDRCTKAHEYIFLLSKSERYFYDYESVKEQAEYAGPNSPQSIASPYGQGFTRKAKSVGGWDTGTGNHSTIEYNRGTRKSGNKERKPRPDSPESHTGGQAGSVPWEGNTRNKRSVWTVSTRPYPEAHFATYPPELIVPCVLAGCPEGGVVLDPFAGSGTTGEVASIHGRRSILIELNPEYLELAKTRVTDAQKQGRLFA